VLGYLFKFISSKHHIYFFFVVYFIFFIFFFIFISIFIIIPLWSQVLGHLERSDASRPRPQLSVPSIHDIDPDDADLDSEGDGDGDGDVGASSFRIPFATRLWGMRVAVQRGYEALYTVQELQHLLNTPMIAANDQIRAEILTDMHSAIKLLSQSVGIKPASARDQDQGLGAPVVALEGGLVAAILQTAKGKKLMSRSIKLLEPEKR